MSPWNERANIRLSRKVNHLTKAHQNLNVTPQVVSLLTLRAFKTPCTKWFCNTPPCHEFELNFCSWILADWRLYCIILKRKLSSLLKPADTLNTREIFLSIWKSVQLHVMIQHNLSALMSKHICEWPLRYERHRSVLAQANTRLGQNFCGPKSLKNLSNTASTQHNGYWKQFLCQHWILWSLQDTKRKKELWTTVDKPCEIRLVSKAEESWKFFSFNDDYDGH